LLPQSLIINEERARAGGESGWGEGREKRSDEDKKTRRKLL
jgi:hypothetical protein